jgi:GDPmannose 4,6-dehydratase
MPEYTGDVTGMGTTRLLEAIRRSGTKTKFYQASSSEMFGDASAPQNEETPFRPKSPYAAAKVYAYWMVVNYRESYRMLACNGILFNHESPRRGETFVTRKITRGLAHILAGKEKKIYLGNLEAKRDWGFAPEYIETMWTILQQEEPDDYVIGTGEAHSIKEFLEEAFGYVNLDWREYVEIDPRYLRPTEVEFLLADPSKARKKLCWNPKINFKDLVKIMVDYDMEFVGLNPKGEGIKILNDKNIYWTNNKQTVT